MTLREDQIRRYSRHVLLPDVGGVGQKRLLAATVEAADAGGAAATAIVYLAAAGVGTIVVTDAGTVTAADVGPLYELADVGRLRVDAVAERVAALNPDVLVTGSGSGSGWRLAVDAAADGPIAALGVGAAAASRLLRAIVTGEAG